MARTAEGAALTRKHYVAQLAIRAAAVRDVTRLWGAVDPTNLSGTLDPVTRAAAVVAQARHSTSTGTAAGYQERFRTAERVGGRAAVRLAAPLAQATAASALRGAGLSGILNARRAGFSAQAAARNGLVKLAGQMTLLVLSGGRDTVIGSAAEDTRASRWQRVTSGTPCPFCVSLAVRGAAFAAEASAAFEAHDHCSCAAEVAYEGSQMPLTSQALASQWDTVTAGLSGDEALNAFRRSTTGGTEE